ncbi:MAG: PaaI family thioesterase [Sandaracinaceae bacterium]
MTADEILELMRAEFPQVARMGLRIGDLTDDRITMVWPATERQLRPGGTISGPVMMTLADTAMYFLVLANVGPVPLAVTTSLHINFLRKPPPGDVVARGRLLKLGSRLAVGDVELFSSASDEIAAHATVTYSLPPEGVSTTV